MHLPLLIIALEWSATLPPAPTTLAWKLGAGDAFTVMQEIRQTTELETQNKPFRQKNTFALQTRWCVKEVDGAGIRITVVVERCESTIATGDGKTAVPSGEGEKWGGAEFMLSVDNQGRVLEVKKGREELLQKLAGDDPRRLKVLGAQRPPEFFRALFQDVLGPLPTKPVTAGDRWQHTAIETLSIFGSFVETTDFSYEGKREGFDSVRTEAKLVKRALSSSMESDLLRVLQSDIHVEEAKGSFLFDAERGRMQQVRKSSRLHGDLTLDTFNGAQRVTFQSVTEVKIDVGK